MDQKDFKMYFRENFNVITYKEPDEAFLLITDNQYHLKILEKKVLIKKIYLFK